MLRVDAPAQDSPSFFVFCMHNSSSVVVVIRNRPSDRSCLVRKCNLHNKMTNKDVEEVSFRFQGLAGLLIDTSRAEARRIKAFVRIFDDNGELLGASASSAPLQRSPTEDLLSESSIIRHVAVWDENSIAIKCKNKSSSLRLQIYMKFPSGSTLPVGQCDWHASAGNVDLQVRAFRIEEAAVRIDTEGDSVLRAHVNRKNDQQIAESLGSLDYSFSKSESMMDTTDLVGSALSMESTFDEKGVKRTPVTPGSRNSSARKTKNRVAKTNDRFLAANIEVSPAMAMDPLAIRRLFHGRKAQVVDNESEESDDSVKSTGVAAIPVESTDDKVSCIQPKSAAVTVSKEHLEYLALNKTKMIGPSTVSSSSESDHDDDVVVQDPTASPLPIPPVESIEFEKKEKIETDVAFTPSPVKQQKQAAHPTKKLSKRRLFRQKKKKTKRNSLIAFEDRDEQGAQQGRPSPKRSFKIRSFFKRQWSPEKIASQDDEDMTPKKLMTAKEKEQKVDTPTAEINYALLSTSASDPLPDAAADQDGTDVSHVFSCEDEESTELSRIGEERHDSLLHVRDQNVTPVDDFYSSSLMENYFSGKPFLGTAGVVNTTPETVTTESTTPERVIKSLLHQPLLVEEAPLPPRVSYSKMDHVIHSFPAYKSSETQIRNDDDIENLSAISEKSSPASSSSHNWSKQVTSHEDSSTRKQQKAQPENKRTLDASVSFEAGIHDALAPKEIVAGEVKTPKLASESVDNSDPLFSQKMGWETFDRTFADDQFWVATNFSSAESAFCEVASRWRQKSDEDGSHLVWESLFMPQMENALNGHVNGEKVQVELKEPSQSLSQSYDSVPGTDDPTVDSVVEPDTQDEQVTLSFSHLHKPTVLPWRDPVSAKVLEPQPLSADQRHDSDAGNSKHNQVNRDSPAPDNEDTDCMTPDEQIEGSIPDEDQWIAFDPVEMENETSVLNVSNEEEFILFDFREQLPKNSYIRGIGALVDWNVGTMVEETDVFEDAIEDMDTVSNKEGDDVAIAPMKLDYSVLSEELVVDLHPSRVTSPKQTVYASLNCLPTQTVYPSSKPSKATFPIHTPHSSSNGDRGTYNPNSWQKKKKKNFVRRFGEGLLGLIACGSHVHIVSSDDDESLCAESQPIWTPNGTKQKGRNKAVARSKQQKHIKKKVAMASNKEKQSGMPTSLDNGYDKIISPAVSDAEDLAWAKVKASRNWI